MSVDVLPTELHGLRVLVVEDQYLVANEITRAIARLGGEVVGPVPGVESALRLISEDRPDLAVLDINLNGDRVFPLARELRRMGVPLIIATGYERSAIDPEFGDAPHVTKPVTDQSLASAFSQLQRGAAR
jgi:two-component SAPR family response regulator